MNQLVAIPVYNEEQSIRNVAAETIPHVRDSIRELLFIDDGSTDGSGAIIRDLAHNHSVVRALHHERNRGYGAVLIAALEYGKRNGYDYLITMDCDRQHQPEDLSRFATFDPEIGILSGSRYLPDSGQSGSAPVDRVEINRRVTGRLNREFNWNLTDAFCGFKRYHLAQFDTELLTEKGYAFPLELWAYAARFRISIREIPVHRIYTTDDRSFGEDLDRRRKRYRYYLRTLNRALRRFALL